MEIIKVYGVRPYAFTDDFGINREGYSLHCLVLNDYVIGLEAKKMSVLKTVMSSDMYDDLCSHINVSGFCSLRVYYNSRGKISSCEIVD